MQTRSPEPSHIDRLQAACREMAGYLDRAEQPPEEAKMLWAELLAEPLSEGTVALVEEMVEDMQKQVPLDEYLMRAIFGVDA